MSSIIEGYNYDIFISYRQKDNKGERWVSNFVDALKTELEATFKEDISVYFDENPHDRLQETHNVDKSLEGKLNCLIFISILSQTYCDPNSYAWQFEFLAFNKLANEDHFGRDVRLKSGNVASRILPIRIHDLDQEDIKLFEKESGSVLRAMDFVFKTSTGVNRPLKVNEDHPQDNLNKTFYADQINKVAHAIKEIVLGMKTEPIPEVKEKDQPKETVKEVREDERMVDLEKPAITLKSKLISTIAILVILIIAGIFVYSKIFRKDKGIESPDGRISVAVIPFQNLTNDTTWNIWQDGIQEMLITSLSDNPEDLSIRQSESVKSLIQSKGITNYAALTPSIAGTISQNLNANIFIYGNIQKAGNKLRINAKLIDTKTEEVLKSLEIEGLNKEESIFDITDSLRKKVTDFLIISKLKKELPPKIQLFASTYTNSPVAYRYFMYGNNAYEKYDMPTAIKFFLQALAIDTNFNFAALRLATAYSNNDDVEGGKKWCLKVYKKRDQMPLQLKLWANRTYAIFFETPYEEIKYYRQLLEIDDQLPLVYYGIGRDYLEELFQFDKAIPEFEKTLEIYNKWGVKPSWVLDYIQLGRAYHKTGQYKKEKDIYKKAEHDFPDHFLLLENQAILSLTEGNTVAANRYIEKYITIGRENSWSDQNITTNIAWIYSEAGIMDKSEEYYRKALSSEPDNAGKINDLAYFLIDNNRNINEGLELVEKALNFSPDNFEFLNTKGWCLFKQGKYQEASEILQKSWDLRRERATYDHEAFLHLEAAKKAVASQKKNEL